MNQAEMISRYRELYLPAVCDALYELGLEEQVLPTSLRPLLPDQKIVGEAFTVEGHAIGSVGWEAGLERIRSYLEIFERLQPDSVLVSVTPPSSVVGHFGELTANSAKQKGCVGVILDGNLRDIQGIRDIGLQVFYRDLSPLNAIGRWEMIASQEPVVIGGVTIRPGDLIIAEFDGVLVVPFDEAERVLETAEGIVSAEGRVRKEMQSGEPPLASLERHGHI